MSDLIDRQTAIDAIEKTYGSLSYQYDSFTRRDAIDILNNLPSISSLKKGKWLEKNMGEPSHTIECSNCGYKRTFYINGISIGYPKFCPECGTKIEVTE